MPPGNTFPTDTDAVREHWNEQAADYSAAKERNAAYFSALQKLFDRAVEPAFRGRVLEAGCGTGEVLAFLEPESGVGVDISERMIDEASRRFADRDELSFAVGEAEHLGDHGEFDAVISADVLEHVPDWGGFVDAMVGACRTGGIVAIATPSPRWALPLWILEKLNMKMPEGPHLFVPLRAIATRLEANGCRVVRRGTHQMVPARLAGLGPRLSTFAEGAPLLRHLGVIQLIVAEKSK
jgi:2-polyprenyl-3-methyl-5-hydroxy-6-metoxy-1,4-benzoquinol methylase